MKVEDAKEGMYVWTVCYGPVGRRLERHVVQELNDRVLRFGRNHDPNTRLFSTAAGYFTAALKPYHATPEEAVAAWWAREIKTCQHGVELAEKHLVHARHLLKKAQESPQLGEPAWWD